MCVGVSEKIYGFSIKMPYLSFEAGDKKDSKPIAFVSGGDRDGELLYIHEGQKPSGNKSEFVSSRYENGLKGLSTRDKTMTMSKLEEAYNKGIPAEMLVGVSDQALSVYKGILDTEAKDGTIRLPPLSSFMVIPTPEKDKRELWYIAGASGSGKSYFVRGLAERYKKLFPDREIYLISKLNEDPVLDKMKVGKPKRINVQTLIDDPIDDIKVFENSFVIFDDYDTFSKPLDKIVQNLIDSIATLGRHGTISAAFLTHALTNYSKTRVLLNECSHYVVYPQATSYKALTYLLASHVGMSNDDIRELRNLGRWVCIHKNYPQYLVSEHLARTLNRDE